MSQRTKERDVLQKMGAILKESLSTQSNAENFGNRMSSAGFISDSALRDILSTMGVAESVKVGKIVEAAKAHITTSGSAERVTEKFDQFVLVLYDMHFDELAQQLVDELSKCVLVGLSSNPIITNFYTLCRCMQTWLRFSITKQEPYLRYYYYMRRNALYDID